jgi:hypothetical protein
MNNFKFIIIIVASWILLNSCISRQEQDRDYPMFWTWLDYRTGMNFDSICAIMCETGLDGVLLNAPTPEDYREAITIAEKYGIEVYAWLWTMNLEHDRDLILEQHPEWFSVNRKGESLADTKAYVDYYKFLCPALPEVREYIKKKIIEYCEIDGLNGIAIDYHRFVDVVLPTTLWPRYGIQQDREYPEWDYGYHPEMISIFNERYGYDPRELEDPSIDENWLQFRCDQITEVANEIADLVHSYGKVMAASPFPTPAMSRQMVRQDWGKWNLDIVFPMVYHNFYTGDVSFIEDCMIENRNQKNPNTTLFCGMTATNSSLMFECMDAAFNNGAEGVSIFTINNLRSPEVRSRFKVYTDSIRALGNNSKKFSSSIIKSEANSNPFEKDGIMDAIDFRMKALLSLENTFKSNEINIADWNEVRRIAHDAMQVNNTYDYLNNLIQQSERNEKYRSDLESVIYKFNEDKTLINTNLREYQLIDEYGVTQKYSVYDDANERTFNVTFYFYGGILSGWNIELI